MRPFPNYKITALTVIFALVVLLPGILALSRIKNGPRYNGKTTAEWLAYYDKDRKTSEIEIKTADEAIQHIGPKAIPVILRMLKPKESDILQFLIHASELHDQNTDVNRLHNRAVNGFRALGEAGKPAIPALIELLDDHNPDSDVSTALTCIGCDSIPQLQGCLTDKTFKGRAEAIQTLDLFVIRSENRAIIEKSGFFTNSVNCKFDSRLIRTVISLLNDDDLDVRWSACILLGHYSLEPELTVPALINSLQDKAAVVRSGAATGLGHYGKMAATARPSLEKALHDPEQQVRSAAKISLSKIGASASN